MQIVEASAFALRAARYRFTHPAVITELNRRRFGIADAEWMTIFYL